MRVGEPPGGAASSVRVGELPLAGAVAWSFWLPPGIPGGVYSGVQETLPESTR
jgi:hypothetical protein